MALAGPVDVRGSQVLVASFDTCIRIALMTGTNERESLDRPDHDYIASLHEATSTIRSRRLATAWRSFPTVTAGMARMARQAW